MELICWAQTVRVSRLPQSQVATHPVAARVHFNVNIPMFLDFRCFGALSTLLTILLHWFEMYSSSTNADISLNLSAFASLNHAFIYFAICLAMAGPVSPTPLEMLGPRTEIVINGLISGRVRIALVLLREIRHPIYGLMAMAARTSALKLFLIQMPCSLRCRYIGRHTLRASPLQFDEPRLGWRQQHEEPLVPQALSALCRLLHDIPRFLWRIRTTVCTPN